MIEVRSFRLDEIISARAALRKAKRKAEHKAWLALIAATAAGGLLFAVAAVAVAAVSHH